MSVKHTTLTLKSPPPCTLFSCSPKMLSKILAYLNYKDLISFCSTCKLHSSEELWQEVMEERKIFWCSILSKDEPLPLSIAEKAKIVFGKQFSWEKSSVLSREFISETYFKGASTILKLFAHESPTTLFKVAKFNFGVRVDIESFVDKNKWKPLFSYITQALQSASVEEISLRIRKASGEKDPKRAKYTLTTGVHTLSGECPCDNNLIKFLNTARLSTKTNAAGKLYLYSRRALIAVVQKKPDCQISINSYLTDDKTISIVNFVYQYARAISEKSQSWQLNYALSTRAKL